MRDRLITVMHTGTRWYLDRLREAGYWSVHRAHAADYSHCKIFYQHFNEISLFDPSESMTLLRSPLHVLASHDRNGLASVPEVISTLRSSYEAQILWIERGCLYGCVDKEPASAIAAKMGITGVRDAGSEDHGSFRDYPLKAALDQRDLGRGKWISESLLDWWLSDMGWLDDLYARWGYEIWWRKSDG